MDNSIRVQRDMISLEAKNPASAMRALTKRLPNYVASVKSFIQSTLGNDSPAVSLINVDKIKKEVNKRNYLDNKNYGVYIPPGLKVSYLQYISALGHSQDIVDRLMDETLVPFSKWLAVQVTNPEGLSSLKANAESTGVKFHDIDGARDLIAKCFNPRDNSTTASYGDVFDRNKDVVEVEKELNDLNSRMGKVSRKDLIEKVNEINDFLTTIVKKVESKDENYQVSGAVLKTLAKVTYNLGLEIEFYSVYGYHLQSLTQAVEDTVEKLDRDLKN